MNIIKVEEQNVVNGPGLRTVVWISGCEHHCFQCHNPETWSYNLGNEVNEEIIDKIIKVTDHEYISGITFTGGDPFSLRNRVETLDLVERLRKVFPNKSFWMWTGHLFEEISMIPGIECFDVIVDGKFEIDKKDPSLVWKGSSNQRIIDVKKSLLEKRIVNYMD